jgi:hypothetical protein
MSENEAALRRELEAMRAAYPARARKALETYDAMLAEHRAALSRARADALEEAAQVFDEMAKKAKANGGIFGPVAFWQNAARIRALITTPAPATIPVERVREVLKEMSRHAATYFAARLISERLGVPLDAKGEAHAAPDLVRQAQGSYPAHGIDLHSFAACRHGRVWPERCPECSR